MRHGILGAGGVGGLIGACLAHAGHSVTLVVRAETLPQHPRQLELESPFGKFFVQVDVASEVPAVDMLWITVKATQLEAALGAIRHYDAIRAIVPLLNGIDHIPLLRAKYGAERVIPATIAVETERVSPGHILQRIAICAVECFFRGKKYALRHARSTPWHGL
jgi:2-dehydropantoate 2-reductase